MDMDIEVGAFLEATIGQPIIAPLCNISEDILPVARSARPCGLIPWIRQAPRSLSIVL